MEGNGTPFARWLEEGASQSSGARWPRSGRWLCGERASSDDLLLASSGGTDDLATSE